MASCACPVTGQLPETRPPIIDRLCPSGIPETQGARDFHRLRHEQMIDGEPTVQNARLHFPDLLSFWEHIIKNYVKKMIN